MKGESYEGEVGPGGEVESLKVSASEWPSYSEYTLGW